MNSRANSLKHGLCASACVPEDLELIRKRSLEFYETLKPQDEVHVWMVGQAALCSIRIDRSQRMERRIRDKISLRAELTWDDDRRFEAEVLGRSLSKDPATTVEALQRTPQGCEWLMRRWAMLAYSADTQQGTWTDEQAKMAFDLLATPHAFREGRKPGVLLDFDGQLVNAGADSAAVARREIAVLKERREVVADLDEVNRSLASSDLTNEGDTELRLLRRYEATLHSRLRWSIKQITIQSPYRCANPSLRPNWVASNEPDLQPEPSSTDEVADEALTPGPIQPAFDLKPEEFPGPGQDSDHPVYLTPRVQAQHRMAEARDMVSRKKVARLGA